MITLHYQKSKSKHYSKALELSSRFKDHEEGRVGVLLKEIFEKWQFFSDLFWIIVKWKGTYINYDGMEYHSYNDLSRIFYALQQAHLNWMCITEHKLVQSYKLYKQSASLEDIDREAMTDEEINQILDAYNELRRSN